MLSLLVAVAALSSRCACLAVAWGLIIMGHGARGVRAGERRRGGFPGGGCRVQPPVTDHRWVGVRGAAAGGRGRYIWGGGRGAGVGVGGRCVIDYCNNAAFYYTYCSSMHRFIVLLRWLGGVHMYMDGRMP